MRFEQIQPFLAAGMQARRAAWGKSAVIKYACVNNAADDKFVQLVSVFGVKRWEPYIVDFSATDWEVLGHSDSKKLARLLGKLARYARQLPKEPEPTADGADETDTTEGLL